MRVCVGVGERAGGKGREGSYFRQPRICGLHGNIGHRCGSIFAEGYGSRAENVHTIGEKRRRICDF